MTAMDDGPPIFRLPNEILLGVFDYFWTRDLLPLASTCHQFHSIILRLFHGRLQSAATLEGHTLVLECGPPEVKLNPTRALCASIDDNCLPGPDLPSHSSGSHVGQYSHLAKLYSRFRPTHHNPPTQRAAPKHPAGDIPGSRTYDAHQAAGNPAPRDSGVTMDVHVDAQALFAQLETVANLVRRDARRGVPVAVQPLCDATIRVWRTWLARQRERKLWTDGSSSRVQQDAAAAATSAAALAVAADPHLDPSVLWVNTRGEDVGVRFRVVEEKWRGAPMFFADALDAPVTYQVVLEEVLIRTTHLLLHLEEARRQLVNNPASNTIVFGSYRA